MSEVYKAIISHRIYFKYRDKDHLKDLMKALTYRIPKKTGPAPKFGKHSPMQLVETITNYKLLPGNVISIPQGRMDLVPKDCIIVDKRITNEVPFPLPKYELREDQLEVHDAAKDTCFVNAKVGWGKTFFALHMARKWGQKTLVVVHTGTLRDQWITEIKKLYGFSPGVVGDGKFDIEDHFIVVGTIQSLVNNIPALSKEFGTIILDEAHHCPATTFSKFIDSMYARYRLALSGTMERTDGKHIIFKDYFGTTVFKPKQANTLNPEVLMMQSGISLPSGLTWVQKINTLLYDPDYQKFIAAIAKAQMLKGHSVLVIGSRVEFLKKIQELIGDDCVLVTGEEKDYEKRKELLRQVEEQEKSCISASTQIFSEGISVNILSCVILTEPSDNPISLEQIIGRIQRTHPNKLNPVVIDIGFSSMSEKRKISNRQAFYISQGWKVRKL